MLNKKVLFEFRGSNYVMRISKVDEDSGYAEITNDKGMCFNLPIDEVKKFKIVEEML